jgi:hypothetical protein
MNTVLQVSIASTPKRARSGVSPALPLLDLGGARIVLGCKSAANGLAAPVVPGRSTLFAPRAACIGYGGSLWVADTGHHRLLGWRTLPERDGMPADILLGQPGFEREGRNAKGEPGPATLNVPTGLAACGAGLALADAWNHRVLLWHRLPERDNQPADVVLGQEDFLCTEANRGHHGPAAGSLFWPYGVAWDGQRLWVADTGNRRVLVWNGLPTQNGQRADLVLGQTGFTCRDENAGHSADAASMRWPHGVAFLDGKVCVADAGNNRVMVWQHCPTENGQPCDGVLGQRDAVSLDHNQGDYWPGAATLNMPYGVVAIGAWLVVADTANSRLVAWHGDDLDSLGAPARRLAAQPDWSAKGDNRWQPATRDSLCWPFGLDADSRCAVIADSGNNRVLLWPWSGELGLS